jgi:hypothetical protein
MAITIKQVESPKQLKQFVYLAEKLNAHRKDWVPPLYSDDLRVLDSRKNPAQKYCDSILLFACDGDKIVGRIAGIINKRYNESAKVKMARFGWLETPDNIEITRALLDAVEKWAKQMGMNRLVGPMGFTEEDSEGFIYEGYHETPSIGCIQNEPYMNVHMEKLGFQKEIDWFVYKVDVAGAMTPLYERFYERASQSKLYRLLEFKKKSELKPYIQPIFKLMNEAFVTLYGFSPLTEHDVEDMANRYMPLLDPRFIKAAVTPENEVIAFIISIPNMAPGFLKARGRLLPFGIFHILAAGRKSKQLDNYLGAVKEEYRGKGADALIGYAQLKAAKAAGFTFIDTHHEMEENLKVRAESERAGGVIYKRYRLFYKVI